MGNSIGSQTHSNKVPFLVQLKPKNFFIPVISSFRRRNLIFKLARISRFLINILASIDQVFLINFQFQVSKIQFR